MTHDDALHQARTRLDTLRQRVRFGTADLSYLAEQLEALDALLARVEPAEKTTAPDDWMRDQAQFISHAVHELRTPMTSIRGYADMLSSGATGALTDMQKQFLETIRANTRRMETLLTDVSDTSKLRAGALYVEPKMDMVKNVALMVEKATRPEAETATKTLTFDIPSGLPLLNVDGELLAKALTKLVENALRYTPQENGEVTVRAEGDATGVVITVQDNGIGMTPDEMEKLGTVYFRSDHEAVRAHKGSGLGIPVAYGIFKLLNATVSVESAPGAGTTFQVRLPAMASEIS